MSIPLGLEDLKLWVSMVAVILIVTNELFSPILGNQNLYINRKRLRNVTYLFGSIFLLVFLVNLYIAVFL